MSKTFKVDKWYELTSLDEVDGPKYIYLLHRGEMDGNMNVLFSDCSGAIKSFPAYHGRIDEFSTCGCEKCSHNKG